MITYVVCFPNLCHNVNISNIRRFYDRLFVLADSRRQKQPEPWGKSMTSELNEANFHVELGSKSLFDASDSWRNDIQQYVMRLTFPRPAILWLISLGGLVLQVAGGALLVSVERPDGSLA